MQMDYSFTQGIDALKFYRNRRDYKRYAVTTGKSIRRINAAPVHISRCPRTRGVDIVNYGRSNAARHTTKKVQDAQLHTQIKRRKIVTFVAVFFHAQKTLLNRKKPGRGEACFAYSSTVSPGTVQAQPIMGDEARPPYPRQVCQPDLSPQKNFSPNLIFLLDKVQNGLYNIYKISP